MDSMLKECPVIEGETDTGANMECKICWYVYQPDAGDEVWQVAPGTPFSMLPSHWRCPVCDAEKSHFLRVAC